ncbi:MAG: S41 family peptidase [Patescibacteria group bacterium]
MNNEKRFFRFRTVLLVLIALLIGYYTGVTKINLEWKNYKPSVSVSSKEPPPTVSHVDFSSFWTVWQKLEADYYDKTKLDPRKMLNGAIEGMVRSLGDPFTTYLPPTQNDNFKEGLAGQFQGIGAELGLEENRIIVVAPLNGSPAQKSGIRAGDTILEVDGEPTFNWSLSQAVEKIRGPKGSLVTLTILHKGDSKTQEIKIIRDVITIESVTYWVKKAGEIDGVNVKESKDKKIAYIGLSQFGDKTNEEWVGAINKLNLETSGGKDIEGLILDLRNNPGGYLSDASFISSEFIERGSIVVIEEEAGGRKTTLSADRKGLFLEVPLIVLINKGSASASEIVAGALRDHERATLLGETSFGKGTIQKAEDLGNGAGLHITIAKWLTPQGNWINEVGLKPDIEVSIDAKDPSHDVQLEKAILELIK